jgi:hypothetical protein
MAGFHTHVLTSTTLGVAYGTAGYLAYGMPPTTAILAAGLCGMAGMIPDLDGDTGVPVREAVGTIAAIVPVLLIHCFQTWGLGRESIVLAAAGVYLLIRFGVGGLFKHFTRHRGMWHSIPAACNVALITFLITSYQEMDARLFKTGAVLLGFLSHLILDELYSFDWKRWRYKESHGTALKLFALHRLSGNLLAYGLLCVLLFSSYRSWTEDLAHRTPAADLTPVTGAGASN